MCGDLTSAFDFSKPNGSAVSLPPTNGYMPPDRNRHPDYVPLPPAVQAVPKQEPGMRPARALPYELFVRTRSDDASDRQLTLEFINTGRAGATFLVYTANSLDAPLSYTVEAGKRLKDRLPVAATGDYDFSVHAPNGFLRRFAGKLSQHRGFGGADHAQPELVEGYDVANGNLQLRLTNLGSSRCEFKVVNAYDPNGTVRKTVRGGDSENVYLDLRQAYGWYDLTITVDSDSSFERRLAGHVETGRSSMTDPALGG